MRKNGSFIHMSESISTTLLDTTEAECSGASAHVIEHVFLQNHALGTFERIKTIKDLVEVRGDVFCTKIFSLRRTSFEAGT